MINYDKIDIRNDNSLVFAPPTKYKLLDDSFAEYKYIGGEILPIPDIIMSNLKQNQHLKPQQQEPQPQIQPQEIQQPQPQIQPQETQQLQPPTVY